MSLGLWIGLLAAWPCASRANVYATNLRVNGGVTNLAFKTSTNLTVTYLLNEPASGGVILAIKSNSVTVRAIEIFGGAPGTSAGTNQIVWDGLDAQSNHLAPGHYTMEVTAAAVGHANWTNISDDAIAGNHAYLATGIAVNCNPNSPSYGRVFVANATTNPLGTLASGDDVGIVLANADGSLVGSGSFSTGGWPWAGDFYSPWKVEVSADDFVYVNDWTSNGVVLRFDQAISTASRAEVLRPDNWPASGQAVLSGPAITGTGTNTAVWMADINPFPDGVGIRRFPVNSAGVIETNDTGVTAVLTGGPSDLTLSPRDVALDAAGNLYVIQHVTEAASPANRVFRFPAYTNGTPPLTNADWRIGAGDDDLRGAYGIAVNPAGDLVAVALYGVGSGPAHTSGGVRVFNAATGADVVTLTPSPLHAHTDVAWDNAGNLYTCDNESSVWRVYSPPGTNVATTVALATLQILEPPAPPLLSAPAWTGGEFQFTLNGQAEVTYVILVSTNLHDWTAVATNSAASAQRLIQLPALAETGFYRSVVQE